MRKDQYIKDAQKVYELTEVEITEIKDTAKDDTLFRVTTLLTLKGLEKNVGKINGTVRTHDGKIGSLCATRTFHNWALGTYTIIYLFILKVLYDLRGVM